MCKRVLRSAFSELREELAPKLPASLGLLLADADLKQQEGNFAEAWWTLREVESAFRVSRSFFGTFYNLVNMHCF